MLPLRACAGDQPLPSYSAGVRCQAAGGSQPRTDSAFDRRATSAPRCHAPGLAVPPACWRGPSLPFLQLQGGPHRACLLELAQHTAELGGGAGGGCSGGILGGGARDVTEDRVGILRLPRTYFSDLLSLASVLSSVFQGYVGNSQQSQHRTLHEHVCHKPSHVTNEARYTCTCTYDNPTERYACVSHACAMCVCTGCGARTAWGRGNISVE